VGGGEGGGKQVPSETKARGRGGAAFEKVKKSSPERKEKQNPAPTLLSIKRGGSKDRGKHEEKKKGPRGRGRSLAQGGNGQARNLSFLF